MCNNNRFSWQKCQPNTVTRRKGDHPLEQLMSAKYFVASSSCCYLSLDQSGEPKEWPRSPSTELQIASNIYCSEMRSDTDFIHHDDLKLLLWSDEFQFSFELWWKIIGHRYVKKPWLSCQATRRLSGIKCSVKWVKDKLVKLFQDSPGLTLASLLLRKLHLFA